MTIFVTSDLHFSHKNIIEYENRPFSSIQEMNEAMINNWNSVVEDKDEVYVLGDFSFAKENETHLIISRLKGRIHLILGNHDKLSPSIKSKFASVSIYKELNYGGRNFVMFHYPIYNWNRKHHGAIHLHGHTHSRPMDFKHPNLFNVGVDVRNYTPITLDYIISISTEYKKEEGRLVDHET